MKTKRTSYSVPRKHFLKNRKAFKTGLRSFTPNPKRKRVLLRKNKHKVII